MDSKIIAVIAVAAVVVAGGSAYVLLNNNGDDATFNEGSYNVLARVNSEGSGFYIKTSVIDSYNDGIPVRNGAQFYNVENGSVVVGPSNANAWKGLVLGTPGAPAIQHVQMLTLAKQMGLEAKDVSAGKDDSNSVFYNGTITTSLKAVDIDNALDGGVLWEPQYHMIIADDKFEELALTNDLFPEHTCCTIIGSHEYITTHSDITIRFLAGYVKAVEYVKKALVVSGGEYVNTTEYNELVRVCMKYTTGLEEETVKGALSTITYLYADDNNGSLNTLEGDIEALAKELKDIGSLTGKVSNESAFAKALVDDSYLERAAHYIYSGSAMDKVKVAVIDGDIHQIAIRVGTEEGFFADYGIEVETSKGLDAGGKVVDNVISSQCQFGFAGAPPVTAKCINGSYIVI